MGLQVAPSYIGDSGFQTPVENDRKLVEYLSGDRGGLLRAADFTVTNVGGSMAVSISAGGAIVKGLTNNTQGSYFAWSNAAENVAWPAASGSARYDTLIIRIVDTQYGADGVGSRAVWEVLSGTPSGSPAILTDTQIDATYPKPGAWLAVADVLVPAGAVNLNSATITRRVPSATRPSRYASNLGYTNFYAAHGVPTTGKYPGERFWCVDTAVGYFWDGTTLRLENAATVRQPAVMGAVCGTGQSTSTTTWNSINGTNSVSFTKLEAASKVKIWGSMTFTAVGGNAIGSLGALINSTDNLIAEMAPNSGGAGTSTGTILLSGIPAGVYTVTGRWRRAAGSGAVTRVAANDWLSLCVEEVG